jgi:hypothetical protein
MDGNLSWIVATLVAWRSNGGFSVGEGVILDQLERANSGVLTSGNSGPDSLISKSGLMMCGGIRKLIVNTAYDYSITGTINSGMTDGCCCLGLVLVVLKAIFIGRTIVLER